MCKPDEHIDGDILASYESEPRDKVQDGIQSMCEPDEQIDGDILAGYESEPRDKVQEGIQSMCEPDEQIDGDILAGYESEPRDKVQEGKQSMCEPDEQIDGDILAGYESEPRDKVQEGIQSMCEPDEQIDGDILAGYQFEPQDKVQQYIQSMCEPDEQIDGDILAGYQSEPQDKVQESIGEQSEGDMFAGFALRSEDKDQKGIELVLEEDMSVDYESGPQDKGQEGTRSMMEPTEQTESEIFAGSAPVSQDKDQEGNQKIGEPVSEEDFCPKDDEVCDVDSSGSEYIPETYSESSEASTVHPEYPLCDPEVLDCTIQVDKKLVDSMPSTSSQSEINLSSDELDEEVVNEEDIIRDAANQSLYIRKVMKNIVSKTGKLKKYDRVYNSFQYCGSCQKYVSNFAQHLKNDNMHTTCHDIQEIIHEKDPQRKKHLRSRLRGKFNHQNNMQSIRRGHGEIILERRPTHIFSLKDFGPCPNCLCWVSKRLLRKHQSSCAMKDISTRSDTSAYLLTQSDVVSGRIPQIATKKLVNEVFCKLKNDEVGLLVRQDSLIVQLGNQWMEKNVGNRLNRGAYTSQIMRLVGRLLVHLRKINPLEENSMFSYLKPIHFDTICEGTVMAAAPSMDDMDDLLKPSNAIKLGFEIKRLINIKIGQSIMSQDNQSKKDCEDLLKMMEIYWGTKITKLARVILDERKYGQCVHLPDPEDIKVLNIFLNQAIADIDVGRADYENYKSVYQVIEAKLVLYNRRRTGEVQAVRIADYKRRKMSGDAESVMGECTAFEKKLLETQEIMTVRGKTGRGVPIILPLEVKVGLDYIASDIVRKTAGINPNNVYLFAARGDGVFWAYDALSSACQRASLKSPDRITSTNLRKYMATMTQVLDLKPNQLEWVTNHMGHTLDVHKIFYRSTSDVLERTQIAKILLLQDHGRIGEFYHKTLDKIQMNDIVFAKEQHISEGDNIDETHVNLEGMECSNGTDPETLEEALEEAESFFCGQG